VGGWVLSETESPEAAAAATAVTVAVLQALGKWLRDLIDKRGWDVPVPV
jgi:hypothetical protein